MLNIEDIKLRIENLSLKLDDRYKKYYPVYEENNDCVPYITIENDYYVLSIICVDIMYYLDKEYENPNGMYEKEILVKTKEIDDLLYYIFKTIVRIMTESYPDRKPRLDTKEFMIMRQLFLISGLSEEWELRLKKELENLK